MKETLDELVHSFKMLHVNSGGCCYLAYALAVELEKRKIPYKLCIQHGKNKGNHYCLLTKKFGYINPDPGCDGEVVFDASAKTIRTIYKENKWSMKYNTYYNRIIKSYVRKWFINNDIKS